MRFQAGTGSNPVSPTICRRFEMVSFQTFFVAHPCPFSRPRLPPLFPFRCQQPHAGHFEGEGEQNAHHAHRRRWRMRARRGPFGRKHASQSPSRRRPCDTDSRTKPPGKPAAFSIRPPLPGHGPEKNHRSGPKNGGGMRRQHTRWQREPPPTNFRVQFLDAIFELRPFYRCP